MQKTVVRQVQDINEDELERDLLFLYHNRLDTADLFVNEAIVMIKAHINEVMVQYQEQILEDITASLRGELVNVIVRSRHVPTYVEPKEEHSAW